MCGMPAQNAPKNRESLKYSVHPRIEKPCPKDWDSLPGDARTRHCGQCGHHVHNLDEMMPDERRRLLAIPGRKCVAYSDSAKTAKVPLRLWKLFDGLRLLRPVTIALPIFFALFGFGCATTRKNDAACPPAIHDKPNTAEEAEDGKTFVTVGILVDERPFWKRWLNLD